MLKIVNQHGEIITMHCRTRFNYDTNEASRQSGLGEAEDDKTQQNFKDECDINTIIRRFNLTGQLPDNIRLPQYIDYEGIFDFQTAMETMMKAEESFMELPAEIRAKFSNSPQHFLSFCENEANRPALKEMGLLKPEPPKTPEPTAPAAEPPAPGPATT